MLKAHDSYPSRIQQAAAMFERQDPVIHSTPRQRIRGPLTSEQLDRFERDGFLSLPGYFSPQEMKQFIRELQYYQFDDRVKNFEGTIREPETDTIRSIFDIHNISPRFDRLTRNPTLLAMMRQLLGSDVYIHQSRINYKDGFRGQGFNWHSDFETWHCEDGMPRMRCISCSISLTENSEYNGPLMLIPGSHQFFIPCVGETPPDNYRSSLRNQVIGVPDRDSLTALMQRGGIKAPKGPPGSLLLFECNTLHASAANLSCWPRSNLFFVYNSVENSLLAPFSGSRPRPAFLANREQTSALQPAAAG